MTLQETLKRVNHLDLRVRGLTSRFDAASRRHRALVGKAQQKKQQLDELSAQLKVKQAKASGLEQEAEDVEARIQTHRDQMSSVTNNKEYQALSVEVNTLKARKSELEQQALEAMSEVEEDQARLATLSSELDEQVKLAQAAATEMETAKAEVADRLAEVQAEFEAAKAELPPKALETYLRLSEIHEGEALGIVTIQSLKNHEYVCSASQMTVPIDMVNRLITRPDELVIDSMSNTIMVLHDDVAERLAPSKK